MAKFFKITILAIWFLTQAEDAVPGKPGTGKLQQKQSGGVQQPTSHDQRGTEEVPFVVKTLPTPKTDTENAQEAQEHKDKAANDRNLVKFTLYLVLVTGALALIGALQLFVFGYQAIQLQRTVRAAKESSDALINIERPWLLVAGIGSRTEFRNNQPVQEAYFFVKNYGKSPAWIIEMGGTFQTVKNFAELPPKPIYKHAKDYVNRGIVVAARSVEDDRHSFSFPHDSPGDTNFQKVVNTQELLWCVYGFVIYKDIFGKIRETRFCSTVDSWPTFKLIQGGGPDYTRHT